MPTLVTSAKVFVSSPSDVLEERIAVIRAVERINRLPQVREKIVLQPFRYEEIAPSLGVEPQVIVDRACRVGECYFVICLFWNRMGTPFVHPVSQDRYLSGSHYEFITAFKSREESNGGFPHILVYRKLSPDDGSKELDETQARLVEDFFQDFEGESAKYKGLYAGFSSLEEFEREVFFHLLEVLHQNPPIPAPELTIPKIVEEDRRLEVASPSIAGINDVVEVWVKICLANSDGLKRELPDEADFPGTPSKADARDKFMAVAFEQDDRTSKLLPLPTEVEIRTSDFEVLDSKRRVELIPGQDSSTLLFALKPIRSSGTAIVQVFVRTKSMHSENWIENSSMIQRIKLTNETANSMSPSRTVSGSEIAPSYTDVVTSSIGGVLGENHQANSLSENGENYITLDEFENDASNGMEVVHSDACFDMREEAAAGDTWDREISNRAPKMESSETRDGPKKSNLLRIFTAVAPLLFVGLVLCYQFYVPISSKRSPTPKRPAEAEEFIQAGRDGDPNAQYELGLIYVGRDDIEAATWFEKAAEQGFADAQYELGRLYQKGHGVEESTNLAKEWFQKAAEQNHEAATNALSELNK